MSKKNGKYRFLIKFLVSAVAVSIVALTALVYYVFSDKAVPVSAIGRESADIKYAASAYIDRDYQVSIFNAKKRMMEKAVTTDCIYQNIFINGIHVGGMTADEAVLRIMDEFQRPLEAIELAFIFETERIIKTFQDFKAEYAVREAVDKAIGYAKTGSLEERYAQVADLAKNPYQMSMDYSVDEKAVNDILEEIAGVYFIQPEEPNLSLLNGAFAATPGKPGRAADYEDMREKVFAALMNKSAANIGIVCRDLQPEYTSAEFMKATSLLGSYTTNFRATDSNRTSNLALAASRINGTVLLPGEIFSTSKHFNPEPYGDNGYLTASGYLQGKIVDSVGGGVCQVASTLYMALLHAELEIVERTNHSMGVTYLDYAYDATLAGDYIDLKFRNNTEYPITIESYLSNGTIYVKIYGFESRLPNRSIRFENALVESTPPPAELIINDPSLAYGVRVVEVTAKTGYKYRLYKLIYVDGVLTDRIQVNTSTYRAIRGEVRVGTGAPAE